MFAKFKILWVDVCKYGNFNILWFEKILIPEKLSGRMKIFWKARDWNRIFF